MAQRTEKEETEFKAVPETLTLCVNNCGVVGNPATNNMCQKCFNATTTTTSTTSHRTRTRSSLLRSPSRRDVSVDLVLDPMVVVLDEELEETKRNEAVVVRKEVSRCSGCRKRVGLTGFRCRCGDLFCAEHRYSDRHDCSYDYKAAGREAIARDNPVVKAAKIETNWLKPETGWGSTVLLDDGLDRVLKRLEDDEEFGVVRIRVTCWVV